MFALGSLWSFFRLEKLTLAVREIGVSRHDGGPLKPLNIDNRKEIKPLSEPVFALGSLGPD